jgi:hypothetical protein
LPHLAYHATQIGLRVIHEPKVADHGRPSPAGLPTDQTPFDIIGGLMGEILTPVVGNGYVDPASARSQTSRRAFGDLLDYRIFLGDFYLLGSSPSVQLAVAASPARRHRGTDKIS